MAASQAHPSGFPDQRHDHARCVEDALQAAEALCSARGARLTPIRRRVFELVWTSHEAVGAYDLLRVLSRERETAAPPTVYRALDFLLEHGLIHRIESLNAFVGCCAPAGQDQGQHRGQFLICEGCGRTAELHDHKVKSAIADSAEQIGFAVTQETVEVRGLCPACQDRDHGT